MSNILWCCPDVRNNFCFQYCAVTWKVNIGRINSSLFDLNCFSVLNLSRKLSISKKPRMYNMCILPRISQEGVQISLCMLSRAKSCNKVRLWGSQRMQWKGSAGSYFFAKLFSFAPYKGKEMLASLMACSTKGKKNPSVRLKFQPSHHADSLQHYSLLLLLWETVHDIILFTWVNNLLFLKFYYIAKECVVTLTTNLSSFFQNLISIFTLFCL